MTYIKIAGAGVSGSYLAYLLTNEGYKVKLYDKTKKRGCNCAWGVGLGELNSKLIDVIKKNTDYFEVKNLYINGVHFNTDKFIVINKPKLLKSFISNADDRNLEFICKKYDLKKCANESYCINATAQPYGFTRRADLISIPTYQALARFDKPIESAFVQFTPHGYVWVFPYPTNQKFAHIGIGDFLMRDRNYTLDVINKIADIVHNFDGKLLCMCGRDLYINPFVTMPNFAVGEAAGLVHPSSGEGIAPALYSAHILYSALKTDEFNNVDMYDKLLRLTFRYMAHEYNWVRAAYYRRYREVLKENKYVVSYIKGAFGINKFPMHRMVFKMVGLKNWHIKLYKTLRHTMSS